MPRPHKYAPSARHAGLAGGFWSQHRAPLRFEPLEERVTPSFDTTSTTLASSANPSATGQQITLTATVVAHDFFFGDFPPSVGSVSFYDGSTLLGTTSINTSTGKATFQTSSLSAGSHSLRAVYPGFIDFFLGNSYGTSEGDLTQTVNAPANNNPPTSPTNQTPPAPATLTSGVGGANTSLHLYAAGADAGGAPIVRVYNPDNSLRLTITAFDPSFTGGVRVAVGDVNGDGTPDVIAGAGPGGAPLVRIFSGTDGSLIRELAAYESTYTGGVYVAAGDLDGDGHAEVITTPDQGGGARVRVFGGGDPNNVVADFLGIDDPNFRGGARVSVGDLNYDGVKDLVVGAGFGGGPRLAAFDGNSIRAGWTPQKLFGDFFVFEQSLRNGVFVGSGDLNKDGSDDLIVGGGPGGGPRVMALSGKDLLHGVQTALANFFAGDANQRGGVRVSAEDVDGDGTPDILTTPGPGGGSAAIAFHADGTAFKGVDAFGFNGGAFVGGDIDPATQSLLVKGGSDPMSQMVVRGHFLPSAPTRVVFSDSKGFRAVVTPTVVTPSRLSVGVPVYIDPKTGQVTGSGTDLTVTVEQDTGAGTFKTSSAGYQINDLPQVSGTPGTLSQNYFQQLQGMVDDTVTNVQNVAKATQGAAGSTLSGMIDKLKKIKDQYASIASQIKAVASGQQASATVGNVGGKTMSITKGSLGTLDREIGASLVEAGQAILGGKGDPNTILGNLIKELEKKAGKHPGKHVLPPIDQGRGTAGDLTSGEASSDTAGALAAASVGEDTLPIIGQIEGAVSGDNSSALDPDFFDKIKLGNDEAVGRDDPDVSIDSTADPNDPNSDYDTSDFFGTNFPAGAGSAGGDPTDEAYGSDAYGLGAESGGGELGNALGAADGLSGDIDTESSQIAAALAAAPSQSSSQPNPSPTSSIAGTYTGTYSADYDLPADRYVKAGTATGTISITIRDDGSATATMTGFPGGTFTTPLVGTYTSLPESGLVSFANANGSDPVFSIQGEWTDPNSIKIYADCHIYYQNGAHAWLGFNSSFTLSR